MTSTWWSSWVLLQTTERKSPLYLHSEACKRVMTDAVKLVDSSWKKRRKTLTAHITAAVSPFLYPYWCCWACWRLFSQSQRRVCNTVELEKAGLSNSSLLPASDPLMLEFGLGQSSSALPIVYYLPRTGEEDVESNWCLPRTHTLSNPRVWLTFYSSKTMLAVFWRNSQGRTVRLSKEVETLKKAFLLLTAAFPLHNASSSLLLCVLDLRP